MNPQPFNLAYALGIATTPPQPQRCAYCHDSTTDIAQIERPLPQGGGRLLFLGCYSCLEARIRGESNALSFEVRSALLRARIAITLPQSLTEIEAAVAAIDALLNT